MELHWIRQPDIEEKANHSLYCLDEGVAVMNEQMGLWVQSLDAPLMAIGDPGNLYIRTGI